MTFIIPSEYSSSLDKLAPYTNGVKNEAKRLFNESINAETRAVTIYQILAMLVEDGRLNGDNLKGNVCCLDVGNLPTEVAVFKQLKAKSITIGESHQSLPISLKQKAPEVHQIIGDPLQTLSRLEPNSHNLITMFNAFSDTLESKEKRSELIHAAAKVLTTGGNFVLTCDSIHWEELKRMEKEIIRNEPDHHLTVTFPSRKEPMRANGWIMRSILVENTLGIDYDKLGIAITDDTHDAFILVGKKVS